MHFLNRTVVGMTFCLRDHRVHFHDVFTDSCRKIQLRYDRFNITQIPVHVVVMAMGVIMVMMMPVMSPVMIFFMMVALVMIMRVLMYMIFNMVMMMAMSMIMVMIMVMIVIVLMCMLFIVVMMAAMALMVMNLMIMMVSMYIEALFLLPVYSHLQMAPPNTAFLHRFRSKCDARDSERIQFLQDLLRIRMNFQKSCRQHIARRAHSAFQI